MTVYCRLAADSDVNVLTVRPIGEERSWACRACILRPSNLRGDVRLPSRDMMVDHLLIHRQNNHRIPQEAIDRLRREIDQGTPQETQPARQVCACNACERHRARQAGRDARLAEARRIAAANPTPPADAVESTPVAPMQVARNYLAQAAEADRIMREIEGQMDEIRAVAEATDTDVNDLRRRMERIVAQRTAYRAAQQRRRMLDSISAIEEPRRER